MKKIFFATILVAAIFTVTGCITINKKSSGSNAGVYKSFDKGGTWGPKRRLVLSDSTGSIASVNVLNLVFDPQDNYAIYILSESNGLFYTYDGGENWFQPSVLNSGNVRDIKIDPKSKCTLYAAYSNRVFKSVDCSRSWQEVYIDTRPINITAIGIDSENSLIIYAGNASGEILKSHNAGASWTTIKKLGSSVQKILADPRKSGVFYVATVKSGLYKTIDSGANWEDLNSNLKRFSGYEEYYDLVMNAGNPNNLFLISRYGIIKTSDGGSTWEALKLITPPLSTRIYAFAVNPKNSSELYYATASTFYKTENGGDNWSTKRLPTTAAAGYLLVDPANPNILYLGARKLSEKK